MEEPKRKKKCLPEFIKQKLKEKRELSKKLLKEKRARLIVKNLPFNVTEEQLKEYFGQHGEVTNVEILKKSDGKMIGCGFIQFKLVQLASKARHHTNGKTFMDRELTVDFAKPKKKYKKEKAKQQKEVEVKEEDAKNIKKVDEEIILSDGSNSENDSNSDLEDHDNYEENDVKEEPESKRPRVVSHDVAEGKTIFIKNVPFDATKEDLKECMLQFGPVYYALICIDRLTEHSKGTAFVKFVNKEDAEKALNAGTELTLLGNILDCHPALEKNDLMKKNEEKKSSKAVPKDSRNLYLVKEGVILAGSKSAQGVSATDMAKRLQIEQYKTQMLRKLNMFVSRERLVVHNLPPSWDDKKLRILFQKYAGPNAVILEARIMRDMRNVDANGVGKSKEYGFVSFARHESALTALRNLNNNPDIFSANKRPIIAFSIENKSMLAAKQKRLEKSRLNNPANKNSTTVKEKKEFVKLSRKRKFKKSKPQDTSLDKDAVPEFSGVTSEPGTIQKMRSRQKLAAQAKMHHENLKKAKKKLKNAKKTLAEKQKDFIRQPKQKVNAKKENDSFSKMVNDYKNKLVGADIVKKAKWYE